MVIMRRLPDWVVQMPPATRTAVFSPGIVSEGCGG